MKPSIKNKFKWAVILLVLGVSAIYLYARYSWLSLYTHEEMKYNAEIVASTKPLPENFLKVWDILFPNSRNNGMNNQFLSEVNREMLGGKISDCKCDEIGYLVWENKISKFKYNMEGVGKYRRFGYGLEYFTTPDKCFDFWMNNNIYWNGKYLNSLNELSVICLNKNIDELNQEEIIRLIAYKRMGDKAQSDTTKFNALVLELKNKFEKN